MTTTEPRSLWALTEEARSLSAEIERLAQDLYSDNADDAALAVVSLEDALLRETQNRDAFRKKADGYCYVISQLRGQAHWRQEEARRLQTLAEDDQERAQRLEDLLIRVLTTLAPDETKFELPSHRISSRRSEAVEVGNPIDLPEEFVRLKTTLMADKAAIKEALKAGRDVPGAKLMERRSWRIS